MAYAGVLKTPALTSLSVQVRLGLLLFKKEYNMTTFNSEVKNLGSFQLPEFSGIRWMMLPFHMEDIENTIPNHQWHDTIKKMVDMAPVKSGVGYLTIDESFVPKGEFHRRPGLHVDGVDENGSIGGWGGGGGWGNGGMIVASSHTGAKSWTGNFKNTIGSNGDCSHMRDDLREEDAIYLLGGIAYFLNETAVHETIPMISDTNRQFVRLSMPSNAPWYEGYTENPLGVKPNGLIKPARSEFMNFRK